MKVEKRIDIYIYAAFHSRGKGPGVYKAVLEYIKQSGECCTLEVEGNDIYTSLNRIIIQAALSALKRVNKEEGKAYEIRIHADCDYFARMLKESRLFKEHDWKTAAGKEIANVDLWKQIYEYKGDNLITSDNDLLDRYECKKEMEEKLCKFVSQEGRKN